MGSVLLFMIGNISLLILLFTIRTFLILNITDRKVIVRISSVIHMSMCLLVGIIFYGGFSHIIVSPLMFISVYYSYLYRRNRRIWSIRVLLIFMNLGFPPLGAFYGEI